jgi:hypothetical protein
VNDALVVHVVHRFKDLLYQLTRVSFGVAAFGHDAIKELTSGHPFVLLKRKRIPVRYQGFKLNTN